MTDITVVTQTAGPIGPAGSQYVWSERVPASGSEAAVYHGLQILTGTDASTRSFQPKLKLWRKRNGANKADQLHYEINVPVKGNVDATMPTSFCAAKGYFTVSDEVPIADREHLMEILTRLTAVVAVRDLMTS